MNGISYLQAAWTIDSFLRLMRVFFCGELLMQSIASSSSLSGAKEEKSLSPRILEEVANG